MSRPAMPHRRRWDAYPFQPIPHGPGWDAYEHQPVAPGPLTEPRSIRCACGGRISFPRRPGEQEITAAIQEHQATAVHQTWAAGFAS